jgi:hypothetical protein
MLLLAAVGYVGAVVGRRAILRAAAVRAVAAAPRRIASGLAAQEEENQGSADYDRGNYYRVFHYGINLNETQHPAALVEERSDDPAQD